MRVWSCAQVALSCELSISMDIRRMRIDCGARVSDAVSDARVSDTNV